MDFAFTAAEAAKVVAVGQVGAHGAPDQTSESGDQNDGTVRHGPRLSHRLNYRP